MHKDDDLSPAEQQEFRCGVGPVKRLHTDRALLDLPRPRPIPLQSRLQHEELLHEMLHGDFDPSELETGEEIVFSQPGLQSTVVRKLRRGQITCEARLDLHGMTVPIAKEALVAFLRSCRLDSKRCVIVIHGKGNGSVQRRPVLKGKVNAWLQRRSEVLAFCSARPVDGGTGAVYVLLKRD
jgi:DNA-nicking Smr family endonuclease